MDARKKFQMVAKLMTQNTAEDFPCFRRIGVWIGSVKGAFIWK